MIIPIFDALNIVILLCCMHFALFGSSDMSSLFMLAIAAIGIAALAELMKSFTHPFLVDPVETFMLAGVAVILLRMRVRTIIKIKKHRNEAKHGTN